MEDMKKMIERYKKELLEYSKASAPSETKNAAEMLKKEETLEISPEQNSDSRRQDARESSDALGKKAVQEQRASEENQNVYEQKNDFEQQPAVSERKKPSVIGYISEDAQKELEKMNVPEEIMESITAPDTAVPPAEDEETVTYKIPNEEKTSDNDIIDIRENGKPMIFNRENAMPSENSQSTAENGQNNSYNKPSYSEIPSFSQTREQITDESDPKENYPTKNTSGVTDNSAVTPRTEFGANETVSNEKAERLTEQPISGTNYNEQLTGRSFEDERTPRNDPDDVNQQNGSKSDISNFTEPVYNSLEDFEKNNRGSGTILFRVYTAREALPIENAVCKVTKVFGGNTHTFYTLITDESGRTTSEPLPAPSSELSQDSENTIQPFSLYDAVVTREGYADVELKEIPVFDGVSSVQQVGMIPAPLINSTREGNMNAR